MVKIGDEGYVSFNPQDEEVYGIVKEFMDKAAKFYQKLFAHYLNLQIALDEINISKDDPLKVDLYVHATNKARYLSLEINNMCIEEANLYQLPSLFPYILDYIKKEEGLPKEYDLTDFKYFDTFINRKLYNLKDKYILMRIIRAVNYYTYFHGYVAATTDMQDSSEDVDIYNVRMMLPLDLGDIESMNTLCCIKDLFDPSDRYNDSEYEIKNVMGNSLEVKSSNARQKNVINKYKCMFSFINPTIEFYFSCRDFLDDPDYRIEDCITDDDMNIVKNDVVKTILAIQTNQVVNESIDQKTIMNKNITFKQILDMLFNFKKYSEQYSSRKDAIKRFYSDNIEEVGMLTCFLNQSYTLLDKQSIEDIDKLLNLSADNPKLLFGSIMLRKKIVDHFFNESVVLQDMMRVKKQIAEE